MELVLNMFSAVRC